MMPVIRVSDAVYGRLQQLATPFVDTPDTVIERLLDAHTSSSSTTRKNEEAPMDSHSEHTNSGRGYPKGEFLVQGGDPSQTLQGRATESSSSNGATRGDLILKSGFKLSKSKAFRWLGMYGYGTDACLKLAERCGWSVTENNLNAQHGDGCRQARGEKQTHGSIPDLSPEDVEEMRELVAG